MANGVVNLGQYGSLQGTTAASTTGGVVQLLTPLSMVWRREVPLSSTAGLVSANTGTGALQFDETDTDIPLEGQWVKLAFSSSREVASLQATSGGFGYLVYAGRDRKDITATSGLTVLIGAYVGQTNRYEAAVASASFGDYLSISTNSILQVATANHKAVAVFEGTVTRNGVTYVQFASIPGGMWYEA